MNKAVLIYANWCGHCQMLKPKWEEAKKMLNHNVSVIEIEDSDPYKHDKIEMLNNELNGEQKVEVMGYPTLFKIQDNKLEYYQKEREPSQMSQFFNEGTEKQSIFKVAKLKSKSKAKSKRRKSRRRNKNLTKRMKQMKNKKSRKMNRKN